MAGLVAARRAALIEAVFAAIWFSWIPGEAPDWLQTACRIGAIAAIVVLVATMVLTRQEREPEPRDPRYGRVLLAALYAARMSGPPSGEGGPPAGLRTPGPPGRR